MIPMTMRGPHMIWLFNRQHWGEKLFEKILAQYWPSYTSLKQFTTIIGADHAWCAMIGCTALEENGMVSKKTAGAHDMVGTPDKCELEPDCGVVIKHGPGHPLAGHYHFTFCWQINTDGKTFVGLGGNQNDEICLATYPISDVVYCFRPKFRKTDDNLEDGEKDVHSA